MPLRLCSSLGSFLLALSLAMPALAEDEAAESASAEEQPLPEPDGWERPPAEEEKPPAPPPVKEVEEVVGDGKPISVGLLLGWGFKTDRRSAYFAADPYQLGVGLRGGYSLDSQLYLGAYFVYYVGGSHTGQSAQVNTPSATTSANYMHFGAEVGYDWWVGPLIVRPSLQVGAAVALIDDSLAVQTARTNMMFGPGFTVVHPWDDFFLGGDLRANLVTASGVSEVLLAAHGGMRF